MKTFKLLLALALLIGLSYEGLMWLQRPIHYTERELTFTHAGQVLSGRLMVPTTGAPPYPVAVFVHGDGPVEYDAEGYYKPFFEALTQSGVACFSWDKPGTGESQGDWLAMDFADRARLLDSAFDFARSRSDTAGRRAGVIGFGQGTWIVPTAADVGMRPDFAVLVSGAVSVADQYMRYAAKRLQAEGASPEEVREVLQFLEQEGERLEQSIPFEDYLYWYRSNAPRPWARLRGQPTLKEWARSKAIWDYDVREDLRALRCPVLALLGERSMRSDVAEVEQAYQRAFVDHLPDWRVKVFEGADHTLRPADPERETNETPFARWWDRLLLDESDFAPGVIDLLTAWAAARAEAY